MKNVKFNQQALNEILGANLLVDGVDGPQTKLAEDRFKQILTNLFLKKSFSVNSNSTGMIGIRMNDSYTDKFTDWGLLIFDAGAELIFFPMSTKPATGAESDADVACLKEGQYVNAFQYSNTGWSKLPFFQQVKPVSIYRDTFVDCRLDRNATVQTGLFGINLHSWLNWMQNILWYKSLNRNICLSEGCQVAQADVWLNLVLKNINRRFTVGDFMSYTLIHLADFK